MLEINNLEGKSEWINETQLIMVGNGTISEKEEMDGITKETITINSIEGSDQTLLANSNGQTFVIGLDHTLFENYNKSDLLLMSNSELKILPGVSDSKLTYSLPSIDQSKGEMVWESNTFEKPLTKDILNVIQESSKGWQEIGKNDEICLDDMNSVEVHDSKLNGDFLIESHMIQSKKLRTDNSDQYIVGYYPVVETCDTVLVPASLMTVQQKTVENERIEKSVVISKHLLNNGRNLNQLFGNDNIVDGESSKWMKSENFSSDNISNGVSRVTELKINNTQQDSLILTQNISNLSETVIPLVHSTSDNLIKAKSKNIVNFNGSKCVKKDSSSKIVENENSTLPEQSLPLKKKAKMKKSPMSGNFNILSGDAEKCGQNYKNVCNGDAEGDVDGRGKGSDFEPSSNRGKRKWMEGTGSNLKKNKNFGEEKEPEVGNWNEGGMDPPQKINENENRYSSITQLLQQLRNEKCINDAIFKILRSGLEEMDVDVLQEMYDKRDNASPDYSSHLKAFALMTHFKQPIAFNRLSEMFHSGWPSLSVIKDWKRRLNSCRKPKMKK